MSRRIAVIGAGAAGTMAAIFAARSGAATVLLERTRDGGRKILISGGGRCNVLPARLDESRFVTDSSPNTLRKIVRGWPLAEQIAFFERDLGIPLVEETESLKLFPASHRARDVRDGLLAHAARLGVAVHMDTMVTDLAPTATGWRISRGAAEPLDVDAVIVATGGLSVPNTGSDGTGLRIIERLGHTMHPTYAALTPLTADPAPFGILSGVSLPVTLTARSATRTATATGGFLFTHHGYSGPSVLDVSHVVVRSR
ncbi:MAG TPA: aminoacetone oxidase family FAD-binding enzyme, partial [Gemmatimonadaceae bacterium]|nr:aminoacetone oxidase family FAD-binding enzyme [Gemmatimonadaceae bacterium]